MREPILFAHRGDATREPENSMAAFQAAWDERIPGIELDVRCSKDGRLVVSHDATLRSTAGIPARIASLTWDELSTCNIGATRGMHASPVLLEEVLAAFPGFLYDIELKSNRIDDTGLEDRVWRVLAPVRHRTRLLVSSFNPFVLRRFGRISGHALPLGLIWKNGKGVPRILWNGRWRGFSTCSFLKPSAEDYVADRDMPQIVWTVDDPAEARRLLRQGASGIISNRPAELSQVFAETVGHEV